MGVVREIFWADFSLVTFRKEKIKGTHIRGIFANKNFMKNQKFRQGGGVI